MLACGIFCGKERLFLSSLGTFLQLLSASAWPSPFQAPPPGFHPRHPLLVAFLMWLLLGLCSRPQSCADFTFKSLEIAKILARRRFSAPRAECFGYIRCSQSCSRHIAACHSPAHGGVRSPHGSLHILSASRVFASQDRVPAGSQVPCVVWGAKSCSHHSLACLWTETL